MIPDTYCSPIGDGYKCPDGMTCMSISITKPDRGFNGFDEICMSKPSLISFEISLL